ncbi:uncharacterized protein LOC116992041 isoform X3 [Catharus ustulatus]|uniref:uncharacterized protein LOC116992041 isoform X3 n=1 Tax=Catharus ustulatus TaxID=91951 RepID=UPI001407395A|nr:uncharacterized protein LOC116992041 isoform X3 [Catharus ustulatus]
MLHCSKPALHPSQSVTSLDWKETFSKMSASVCCDAALLNDATFSTEQYWQGERLLRMSLQAHGWWCGTDGARVTSRLFSGPCKQSRPMTCIIVPFEEEASSVTTKKNQGVPLLTIGSSSWLQRGVQLPFQVFSCHSSSQQDCVCCSTNCRAREANLRSLHIVIPSVVSFTMCSAPASEFCLTDQIKKN